MSDSSVRNQTGKNIQNGWYESVLPVLWNTMLQVHKEVYIQGKVKILYTYRHIWILPTQMMPTLLILLQTAGWILTHKI